jgi:SPASM domain peptide maturase of grasp-with-spasm system
LTELGCYDFQLKFYKPIGFNSIENVLQTMQRFPVKSVELFVHYSSDTTKKQLRKLAEQFFIIKNIFIHSSPKDEAYIIYPEKYRNNMGNILFVKQKIDSAQHCGFISPKYFTYDNMFAFNEAKQYNNCLNRKISIDQFGEIKNCPAMTKSFGNIEETLISEVISKEEFSSLWKITKDQTDKCKVCEFRYICTDCRAFTENNELTGKPLKCGYDPIQGKWENEKYNKLLIQKV